MFLYIFQERLVHARLCNDRLVHWLHILAELWLDSWTGGLNMGSGHVSPKLPCAMPLAHEPIKHGFE